MGIHPFIRGVLTLTGQPVSTKLPYYSPTQQDEEGESKMKKHMCQDKSSLMKEKQRPCMGAKENKIRNHCVPSADDVHHFLGSRASVCVRDCSGRQTS